MSWGAILAITGLVLLFGMVATMGLHAWRLSRGLERGKLLKEPSRDPRLIEQPQTCQLVRPDPNGDPYAEMLERMPDLSPDGPRPVVVPIGLHESIKQENTMLRSRLEEAEYKLRQVRTEQTTTGMLLAGVLRPRVRLSVKVRSKLETAYAANNRIGLQCSSFFYFGAPDLTGEKGDQP